VFTKVVTRHAIGKEIVCHKFRSVANKYFNDKITTEQQRALLDRTLGHSRSTNAQHYSQFDDLPQQQTFQQMLIDDLVRKQEESLFE